MDALAIVQNNIKGTRTQKIANYLIMISLVFIVAVGTALLVQPPLVGLNSNLLQTPNCIDASTFWEFSEIEPVKATSWTGETLRVSLVNWDSSDMETMAATSLVSETLQVSLVNRDSSDMETMAAT